MSTSLESRIHEVTVFRSGARVTRIAELPASGASRVRVVRLPLALDDGSVRARVEGEGAATDLRVTLEVPPASPALAAPTDEERIVAQLELARARAEVERVTAMIARVQAIAIVARPKGKEGEPPIPSPTEARRALVTLRTEEQARLSTELAERERALRAAERKNAQIRERVARATTARNPKDNELWKSVVVTLDGSAKGRLVLEYLVPGARWSPSYSVAVGAGGKRAELSVRAAVAQRTGEDWSGVRLVLSTADAERWTELPILKSVRIGRAQRGKAARGWREPPVGALELYADYDRAFGPPGASRQDIEDFLSRSIDDDAATQVATGRREASLDDDETQVRSPYEPSPDTPVEPQRAFERTRAPSAPGRSMSAAMTASATPPMPPGAPPAAPRAAAMPMGGAGYGGPPQLAAPMRMRRKEAAPEEPAAPAGLDLEALAYGRLRMSEPSTAGRGALIAASTVSLYMESLGASVSIDVLAVIRVAMQHTTVGDAALPPGHIPLAAPSHFDFAYVASGPATVPSDGAFHVLPVAAHDVPARVTHVAVPRETQDVFRVLELSSPIDAALPPGPIDVYQGGAFLMSTRLPPTLPRGKIRLGLGVDQAIKIARNTQFAEKSTGLLGGGLSLVHEIEVELRNGTPDPVDVEVRERVPSVAEGEKDVEVVVESAEPAWNTWTQEDTLEGGYRWQVAVAAGQKQKLTARYVVKLSSKHELAGGNRREA